MSWQTSYVFYRLSDNGTLQQVHQANDLKAAKYWLTYIAMPGDVGCRTPVNPKHSGGSDFAEYWGHKEQSGLMSTDQEAWFKYATGKNFNKQFPDKQQTQQASV